MQTYDIPHLALCPFRLQLKMLLAGLVPPKKEHNPT